MPLAGGEAREFMPVAPPQHWEAGAWTPDSRHIIVNRMKNGTDGANDVLIVPSDGGPARTLEMPKNYSFVAMRVQPDGKRIAYVGGELRSEVWALENFLPPATTARR